MNFPGLPSISGMVKVAANGNQLLVVHDTKGLVGPRLGVIDVEKNGPRYQAVDIHDWPSSENLPNDVEGICAIPNRLGEYLLAESGYYPKYGNFGRVLKIRYPGGSVAGAEYLGSFRPFPAPPNNSDTLKHEQIEGIAAVAHAGTTALLFALRGAKNAPGTLVGGKIENVDKHSFQNSFSSSLSRCQIANRGAADLFVRPCTGSTNRWDVLSVATMDPGNDLGPSLRHLPGRLPDHRFRQDRLSNCASPAKFSGILTA